MHKDYKPIRRAKKSMVQILFGRTAVIMILLAVHFFLLFGLLMKLLPLLLLAILWMAGICGMPAIR